MSTKLKQTIGTILFLLIAIGAPLITFSIKYPKLWDFRLDTELKVSALVLIIAISLFFVFRKFVIARIRALTYGWWKTILTVAPAMISAWILYGLVYAIHEFFEAFSYVTLVIAICESIAWGVIYPFLMYWDYKIIQDQREAATISALKKAGVIQP